MSVDDVLDMVDDMNGKKPAKANGGMSPFNMPVTPTEAKILESVLKLCRKKMGASEPADVRKLQALHVLMGKQ